MKWDMHSHAIRIELKDNDILEPHALAFFAQQIMENDYLPEGKEKLEFIKALFDLQLAYSIFFMRDKTSSVSIDILNGCMQAIIMVEKNIDTFIEDKETLKAMLTDNKLLSELCQKMNVDSENPNARQNKLFEIILKMFKVEKLIRSKEKLAEEEKPFEICLANNKSIKEYADAIDIIYEGASFSA